MAARHNPRKKKYEQTVAGIRGRLFAGLTLLSLAIAGLIFAVMQLFPEPPARVRLRAGFYKYNSSYQHLGVLDGQASPNLEQLPAQSCQKLKEAFESSFAAKAEGSYKEERLDENWDNLFKGLEPKDEDLTVFYVAGHFLANESKLNVIAANAEEERSSSTEEKYNETGLENELEKISKLKGTKILLLDTGQWIRSPFFPERCNGDFVNKLADFSEGKESVTGNFWIITANANGLPALTLKEQTVFTRAIQLALVKCRPAKPSWWWRPFSGRQGFKVSEFFKHLKSESTSLTGGFGPDRGRHLQEPQIILWGKGKLRSDTIPGSQPLIAELQVKEDLESKTINEYTKQRVNWVSKFREILLSKSSPTAANQASANTKPSEQAEDDLDRKTLQKIEELWPYDPRVATRRLRDVLLNIDNKDDSAPSPVSENSETLSGSQKEVFESFQKKVKSSQDAMFNDSLYQRLGYLVLGNLTLDDLKRNQTEFAPYNLPCSEKGAKEYLKKHLDIDTSLKRLQELAGKIPAPPKDAEQPQDKDDKRVEIDVDSKLDRSLGEWNPETINSNKDPDESDFWLRRQLAAGFWPEDTFKYSPIAIKWEPTPKEINQPRFKILGWKDSQTVYAVVEVTAQGYKNIFAELLEKKVLLNKKEEGLWTSKPEDFKFTDKHNSTGKIEIRFRVDPPSQNEIKKEAVVDSKPKPPVELKISSPGLQLPDRKPVVLMFWERGQANNKSIQTLELPGNISASLKFELQRNWDDMILGESLKLKIHALKLDKDDFDSPAKGSGPAFLPGYLDEAEFKPEPLLGLADKSNSDVNQIAVGVFEKNGSLTWERKSPEQNQTNAPQSSISGLSVSDFDLILFTLETNPKDLDPRVWHALMQTRPYNAIELYSADQNQLGSKLADLKAKEKLRPTKRLIFEPSLNAWEVPGSPELFFSDKDGYPQDLLLMRVRPESDASPPQTPGSQKLFCWNSRRDDELLIWEFPEKNTPFLDKSLAEDPVRLDARLQLRDPANKLSILSKFWWEVIDSGENKISEATLAAKQTNEIKLGEEALELNIKLEPHVIEFPKSDTSSLKLKFHSWEGADSFLEFSLGVKEPTRINFEATWNATADRLVLKPIEPWTVPSDKVQVVIRKKDSEEEGKEYDVLPTDNPDNPFEAKIYRADLSAWPNYTISLIDCYGTPHNVTLKPKAASGKAKNTLPPSPNGKK